eukprot:TRINITY_DN2349_c0_g1_i1.p1 TRINITY_DN2349_c0_g1~~TRINITY_DN2349_c0_g1_i1.p1  ORF type:complete len:544 (-),score=78.05 TRINITY_DN2349_c0_g1_i1:109-1740(-)
MDVFDANMKNEVANLVKSVLATFTTEYVKFYALGLVKKAEDEAGAEPGPAWQLTERPEGGHTDPLKTGFLTKKGAIKKNWKKRWFVVRSDYVVEYYENEKQVQAAKPKPKGKMFLAGYRVVEDPNAGIIQNLEKLAKQMQLDISELPKPKKYPETVFEVQHSRRRCYMIEAANKEEKDAWMAMFRTVCWYAWGFDNRDPVHVWAFQNAIRETRWSLGRWGWWSSGGSETQLLSDIINDEIEYQTLGKIYSKIPGPWIIRSKIRDTVLKTIDGMVSSAVSPAWAAMSKTVEELRPKVEPTIKELVDPLGKQKAQIIEKMKDGVVGIINPIMDEHVKPHLTKILEIIKSPVVEGYEELKGLLDKQFGVFASKFNPAQPDENFRDLDYFSRWSWWEARPATQKFDVMYEPLWALHVIFSDIYPWSTIYNGQDQLRKILDNAVWTYQVEIKKAIEEKIDNPCETCKTVVFERFEEDARLATTLFYLKIFKDMIMPAFNKLVKPACKMVIDPLAELIPEPMKQFIDIHDMFDKLLNGIIDDVIKNILN